MNDVSAKALSEVRKQIDDYAARSGYELNPVHSIKEVTLVGLAHNLELYGKPYCTCHMISEELLKDKAEADRIVCPCTDHVMQIAEQGCCHCGLFMTKNMSENYLKDWSME